MTVNKVGRPSKADERVSEILTATATVAARDGLANTTMSNVAAAAGLQRTLVLHYFKSRDDLVARFLTEAVARYGAAMLQSFGSRSSLRKKVTAMFGPGAYASRDDLVIWADLVALAGRDATVREQLRTLWTEQWLPELERQLRAEFPAATAAAVSSTAFGLACLFEAYWAFQLQDVTGTARRRQATNAALTLLEGLNGEG